MILQEQSDIKICNLGIGNVPVWYAWYGTDNLYTEAYSKSTNSLLFYIFLVVIVI